MPTDFDALPSASPDDPAAIAQDIAAIGRIDAVPSLLRVICETTGMGFAAVARVTDGTWTACAVQDDIAFGLQPGGQLDVHTTLCMESRIARAPVVIDHASLDPVYCGHHTPRLYHIESYISVPIVLPDGVYFGNLCAIDPRPANVSAARIVSMFKLFAELIGLQLANERRHALERAAFLDERAVGELREQFIAVLGHDLRNPLGAVTACAELLDRYADDAQRVRSIAQRVTSSSRRMARLIDDVLDFARGRLGGGFAAALGEVVDLDQALNDVVAEVRLTFARREIRADIGVDRPVRCDRGRIQQLAANLLVNALTHGAPDQPVLLSARTDGDSFALTVRNEGEPIPADSLPKVFAPFWRRSNNDPRAGLGLGLFICAQIVKAHGGTLQVTSSRADGTTFATRLPAQARGD
jgi:signal transduction histidine kinase